MASRWLQPPPLKSVDRTFSVYKENLQLHSQKRAMDSPSASLFIGKSKTQDPDIGHPQSNASHGITLSFAGLPPHIVFVKMERVVPL